MIQAEVLPRREVCPDCGKPLTYVDGDWYCLNRECEGPLDEDEYE